MPVDDRKGFAIRLYGVIRDRCGSFEKFKRLLKQKKVQVREVTVRGWLPPLEKFDQDPAGGSKVLPRDWNSLRTADLPGLREVATILDISVDYLLGYPVPKRRSDREPTGELARALLEFVVHEYMARASHQRRDGLAEVVGGKLKRTATRRKPAGTPEPVTNDLRIELADLALSRLMLVIEDPQQFLERITVGVFDDAEKWESEHKEPERQAVRDDIRRLVPNVHLLASETGETPEKILTELLAAALDPLAPRTQTWVKTLGADLSTYLKRSADEEQADAELKASMLATLLELERLEALNRGSASVTPTTDEGGLAASAVQPDGSARAV